MLSKEIISAKNHEHEKPGKEQSTVGVCMRKRSLHRECWLRIDCAQAEPLCKTGCWERGSWAWQAPEASEGVEWQKEMVCLVTSSAKMGSVKVAGHQVQEKSGI